MTHARILDFMHTIHANGNEYPVEINVDGTSIYLTYEATQELAAELVSIAKALPKPAVYGFMDRFRTT